MSKRRIVFSVLIFAVLLGIIAYVALSTVVDVKITKISKELYSKYINLNGSIEYASYDIIADSDVIVSNVFVSKGDRILKGQSVCDVDLEATAAMSEIYQTSDDAPTPSEIVSEYDGTVKSLNVKKGDIVLKGESIAQIGSNGKMRIKAYVGEANVPDIKVGQKAEISGSGFKNLSYTATVTEIGKSAKKITSNGLKTVVVEVYLDIDNADSNLKTGFTTKVKLFLENPNELLSVPHSAVSQDQSGEYVFIYNDGKAEKNYIKTGMQFEHGYEVLEGVNEGDYVITNPEKIKQSQMLVSANDAEG